VNWQRRDLLPLVALGILGSFAFMHLLAVPAFEDEGSQIRLIYRIIDAGEWLQPLNDGKPLEAWLMVPWVWLGLPALTVIRTYHVLAGIIGAVLTYRLALPLSCRPLAFACGALFALCPFVVYLQRFALSEMFLCSASIWTLVSTLGFIDSATWRRSAQLATALVVCALCKLPVGFVALGCAPLALLLMPAGERRRVLQPPGMTRLLGAYAPAAVLIAAIMLVALVRLQHGKLPGFGLQVLAGIGLGHYRDIAGAMGIARMNLFKEITTQLSLFVTVMAVIGLAASAWLGDWRQRWLIGMGAAPLLALGLLTTFWFPRYLLFTLPPLIVSAVCGWRQLLLRSEEWQKPVEFAVWALCAAFMAHQSALIIFSPLQAEWSPVDRFQYFEGWSSGYGYPEAAKFVLAATDPPRMIYSLDGHSAYQLRAYLPPQWSTRVSPIFYAADGRTLSSDPERLANLLSGGRAWIIVSRQLLDSYLESSFGRGNLDAFGLRQIALFDKPGARSQLALYEVRGIMSTPDQSLGARP
jgi:hypothetical protein